MLLASIIGLTLCLNQAAAESEDQFIAGQHYEVLEVPVGTIGPTSLLRLKKSFLTYAYIVTVSILQSKHGNHHKIPKLFFSSSSGFRLAWALMAQVFYAAEGWALGRAPREVV